MRLRFGLIAGGGLTSLLLGSMIGPHTTTASSSTDRAWSHQRFWARLIVTDTTLA